MKFHCMIVSLLACAPAVVAQETREAVASRKSEAATLEVLTKEFEAAQKTARDHGGAESPAKAFGPRFLAAGADRAGDEAIPFYEWVLRNCFGEKQLCAEAVGALARDHLASEKIGDPLKWIALFRTQDPEILTGLGTIAEKSPHAAVRSEALYVRATLNRDQRGEPASEAQLASAVADLEKAVQLAPDSHGGKRSNGVLYELRNLEVGMRAPEIEGTDLDGSKFKLSDYRGQVLLLDFWGDW